VTSSPTNMTQTAPLAGKAATLAHRYALALYTLATEQRAIESVTEQVVLLQNTVAQVPELRQIIADPRVTSQQMQQAFTTVAQQNRLSGITANFLSLLAQKRRARLLPAILAAFMEERARRLGEITAQVRVARPLSAAQQQQIISHLAQATGKKVHLLMTEDPALISGMIINYGSMQIDASLRGRLVSLTQQLREAA